MGGRYTLMGMLGLTDNMSPTLRTVVGQTDRLTKSVNAANAAIRNMEFAMGRMAGGKVAAALGIGGGQAQMAAQTQFQRRAQAFLDRQIKMQARAAQQELAQQTRQQRMIELANRRQQQQEARAAALAERQRMRTIENIGKGLKQVGTGFVSTISQAGSLAWKVLTAPIRAVTSLPGLLGLGGGAYGLFSLVKGSIDFAASMEQAQIGFTTMLGSADKAKAMVSQLFTFAAKTPFEFPEVQQNARMLMAMGMKTEGGAAWQSVMPWMTSIGNAVSALGGNNQQEVYQRTILAIGQISAKGKLMGEEIRQLAETGIPVVEMLAKKLGMTKDEIMQGGRAAISSERALKALMEGLNEKYAGGMEAQSKSWNGLITTIRDYVRMTTGALGEGIRSRLQPQLQAVVTWFENNEATVARWRDKLQAYGYVAANALAGAFDRAMAKLDALFNNPTFQGADFFGKVSLAWKALIGDPLAEWWSNGGEAWAAGIGNKVGDYISLGITNAIERIDWKKVFGTAASTWWDLLTSGPKSSAHEVTKAATGQGPMNWGSVAWSWLKSGAAVWAADRLLGGALRKPGGSLIKSGANSLWKYLAGGDRASATVAAGTEAAAQEAAALSRVASRAATLSKGAGVLGRVSKVLGPIGLLLTGFDILTSQDRSLAIGRNLGGWGGAVAGGQAGAAVGALFGGAGALPGALIGTLVGGLGGSAIGQGIVEEARKGTGRGGKFVMPGQSITPYLREPERVGMGDLRRAEAEPSKRYDINLNLVITRADSPDDEALAERSAEIFARKLRMILENG